MQISFHQLLNQVAIVRTIPMLFLATTIPQSKSKSLQLVEVLQVDNIHVNDRRYLKDC